MQTSLFIILQKIVFIIEFNGEYFGTNKMLTNRMSNPWNEMKILNSRIIGIEEAKDEHRKWEEKNTFA